MRSDQIHPGDVIAGKYRVRTILGRSHGLLVEAFHTEFDQRVIIKILLGAQADEREVERFRREARTLSKLESEHVARIIDVGTEPDGSFYLVRQYLEGVDLDTHIKQVGALQLHDAILFILQAAEAVAETHTHGIILREIQPNHLFLTQRTGGSPLIKVIDFGTAKLMRDVAAPSGNAELTATAMFGLSPYSSPELVRKARNVDVRADVWSLGAILYEMLTGVAPFAGEMAVLMLAITREEPTQIHQLRPDLPAEFHDIFRWALAKDVDARFRNIHAFAHALSPFAHGEAAVLIDRIGQMSGAPAPKSRRGSTPPPPPSRPVPMRPLPGAPGSMDGLEDSVTVVRPPLSQSGVGPQFAGAAGAGVGPSSRPGSMPPPPASVRPPPPQSVRPPPSSHPASIPPPPPPPSFSQAMQETSPAQGWSASAPHGASVPPSALSPAAFLPAQADPPPARNRAMWVILGALVLALPTLGVLFYLKQHQQGPFAVADGRTSMATPPATQRASVVATVPLKPAGSAASAKPEPAPPASASTAVVTDPVVIGAPSATPSASAAPSAQPVAQAPRPSGGGWRPTHSSGPQQVPAGGESESEPEPKPVEKPEPKASGDMGKLVAIASGGSCAFSVNGSSKGTNTTLKLELKPGTYSVSCKPSSGATKTKSVTVKAGGTAMAMFKL